MINTTALGRAICEKYGSAEDFSAQIGWAPSKTLRLLAGEYLPDVEECAALADCLDLTQSAFYEIFLPEISRNGEISAQNTGDKSQEKTKNYFSSGRAAFDACLSVAKALAAETPVQVASSRRGSMGVIELSSPLLVLDDGCSFEAREALGILLGNASSVVIRPDSGVCRLRFGFRLYGGVGEE